MLESRVCFENAKGYLSKRKWEFFTHDMPGTQPLKVLLRGLKKWPKEIFAANWSAAV